ncbi:hypothetical protein AB1K32_21380 [Metabacillus dongyingensis]
MSMNRHAVPKGGLASAEKRNLLHLPNMQKQVSAKIALLLAEKV